MDSETIKQLSWADRVTLARSNSMFADDLILSIRDEAEALSAKRYCGWRAQGAIADAAQALHDAFTDCDPADWADHFDELDALLCDDEPEAEPVYEVWSDADKMRVFGGYR
jgi:hypothetical protein